MRRILIVTHSYSPMLNPRAFRWTALAEYWAAQGHEVDVICAWFPYLSREETLNGVRVIRVGGTLSERLRKVFLMTRTHVNVEAAGASANSAVVKHGNALRHIIRWLHDQTWKRLYWPDYACLWHRPAAVSAKRLLDQHRHELMISVSDPFTSHLVALSAKAHIPSIRWIADVGDPFSFRDDAPTNNYAIYANKNRRTEQAIFLRASLVAVTCRGTADEYAHLYPESAAKISVIPPLLSRPSLPQVDAPLFQPTGAYRMLFIGTLYKRIRNPRFLLELFAELHKELSPGPELHFIGSLNDCAECFQPHTDLVGTRIVLHGLRDRDYVWRAMAGADLLINIANNNPFQLPSKLVDYVQSGKPIVNIRRIPNDAASSFLEGYPRLLNLHDTGSIPGRAEVQTVKRFILHPPADSNSLAVERWLDPHTIERVAAAYMAGAHEGERPCSP